MRRAHAIAAIVEKAAGQKSRRTLEPDLPGDGVGGEFFLHGLEQVATKDRFVLATMHLTPIGDFAGVEPVLEEMGERPHAKANTAALAAIAAAIDLGPDAPPVELCNQSAHGAELEIKAEDGADRLCLLGHDFEFLVEAAIAERNGSADPEALAFRGRDLVAYPLADHLALELGKGEQHIEGEPPHA